MKRFLVPGWYHRRTRIHSVRVGLYWTINVALVSVTAAWFGSDLGALDAVVVIALGLAAWMSIYEVGYLENDLITTQREARPTLRLDAASHARLLRAYATLIPAKYLVAGGLVALIATFGAVRGLPLQLLPFVGWLALMRGVYAAHNATRNRWAIATFALLQVTKYAALPLLVAQPGFMAVALVAVPMAVLEYASMARFRYDRLSAWMTPFPRARVAYYALASSVLASAYAIVPGRPLAVALGIAVGLLAFRTLAWAWLSTIGRGRHPPREEPAVIARLDDG